MPNAADYLDWRGDLSFAVSAPNEVDIFIASQLSTPDFSNIVGQSPVSLKAACEKYFEKHTDEAHKLGVLQSGSVIPLLKTLGSYPRYSEVLLSGFVNRINLKNAEQFSAVTVDFPCSVRCVCFRGTDDTIVGWKEDFRLALRERQPAQEDAADYLIRAADGYEGRIIVCGHSKGGNLAVYAAVNAPKELKSRISAVYSFDGPGFGDGFLSSEAYKEISGRIFTVISQHSMVGVIMKTAGRRIIVKSRVSGPLAHDGFNWEVLGPGFVKLRKQSAFSLSFENALNTTVANMSDEEIEAFIEEFFGPMEASGAITLSELEKLKPSAKIELVRKIGSGKRGGKIASSVIELMLSPKSAIK